MNKGFLSITVLIIIAVVAVVGGGSAVVIQQQAEKKIEKKVEMAKQDMEEAHKQIAETEGHKENSIDTATETSIDSVDTSPEKKTAGKVEVAKVNTEKKLEIQVELEEASQLTQKIECQTIGKIYHEEKLKTIEEAQKNSNIRLTITAHEYTYNKELDSCLYFSQTLGHTDRGPGVYNQTNTKYITSMSVIDILSDKMLLYFEGLTSSPETPQHIQEFESKKIELFST